MSDDLVSVRYMVADVEEAIDFYTTNFGFELRRDARPAFAEMIRGSLRLLLAGPESSAGPGGQQILLDDPSGNPIELFQPASR